MGDPYLNRALRLNRKAKRLAGKSCLTCGYDDESALQNVKIALCANCRKLCQGQSLFEDHHFPGRKWTDFTIPLPANDHAILTGWFYDHPLHAGEEDVVLAGLYARLDLLELLYHDAQKLVEEIEEKRKSQ